MRTDKLVLFIIDDSIPKIAEYVERSVYTEKISKESLLYLINNVEWKGQANLKQLASEILFSDHSVADKIEVWGFTHPSICLDEIENGLKPDIIIYDWEYEGENSINSSRWLKEIMENTHAFVFVYSMVRNEIPPFLNKPEFDSYSHRFQLFLKGDSNSSVFTSEEFILQYVLSQITKNNTIKIQGLEIAFKENGYLADPTDILHIERILGRLAFRQKLENRAINNISEQSIEHLLSDIELKAYYDQNKRILVTSDNQLLINKIEHTREMNALEVLKVYGLLKLEELLKFGVVKV